MTFLAGQVPTADELNELLPTVVYKTANTSRTSTTTITDDPDLTITLGEGTWRIEAAFRVTGASSGDFKCAWSTSGVTFLNMRGCYGPALGVTQASDTTMRAIHHGLATERSYGTDGTNNTIIHELILLSVATTATMTLQWAQDTSSGTATVLGSGSHIYAVKIA